jgi:hypothetical protein
MSTANSATAPAPHLMGDEGQKQTTEVRGQMTEESHRYQLFVIGY